MRSTLILSSAVWLAVGALGLGLTRAQGSSASRDASARPMSFHNRLLLNRAAVSGVSRVEVMFLAREGQFDSAAELILTTGGRVLYSDKKVGYLRASLPTDAVVEVGTAVSIDAYQVASGSRATWYRDGPPQTNAEMFRGFEVPVPGPPAAPETPDLPTLSIERSRAIGYTAGEDAGVARWLAAHPSSDGRGVVIASLESALVDLTHPILATAKTLDGVDVPKIVGVISTVDPDAPDETRVSLNTDIHAPRTWVTVGDRTYVMPESGEYRFGVFTLPASANLVHRFGVLESVATGEIWVDTNGDASFQDESPVADVNARVDVRSLHLTYPKPGALRFVMAHGRRPHQVHLYVASSDHHMMTLSVAAGSKSDSSVAFGVAPNARLLLVRVSTPAYGISGIAEGYLEAARRPDVDLIADALGIGVIPDTAADFFGRLLSRIVTIYGKPVFHGAGNQQLFLNTVSALGGAFSVGGSMGPRTFAALYGGATLDDVIVHPVSAAGPAFDGALKPDFIAPMNRIAAELPGGNRTVVPKNAPAYAFPDGYHISCCTSASAPYAAGVGALLLSRAKQEHVAYSVSSLGRALAVGARFLPEWPAHEQGNGVLDVAGAWREMKRQLSQPQITSRSTVSHALAAYAARGHVGEGLFERVGWHTGMTGHRLITLRRSSGPDAPVSYRLSWTGYDGTFATASSILLPRDVPVDLRVTVTARAPGAHSAILNLHDSATDDIVFRTEAAVVVSDTFSAPGRSLHLTGQVELMRTMNHYVEIPEHVAALGIRLRVIRGTLRAAVLPGHGLFPNYYAHVHPALGRTLPPGEYDIVLPYPEAGVWTLNIRNDSAWSESNALLVSTERAEYEATLQIFSAQVEAKSAQNGSAVVEVRNSGARLEEPVLQLSPAALRSHRGQTLKSGMPSIIDIDVPAGASTLGLALRSPDAGDARLELYLYDCTTGECFSYDFTLPASRTQQITVRRPAAGHWIAAVNAAPYPAHVTGYVLNEVIATGPPERRALSTERSQDRRSWRTVVDVDVPSPADGETTRALLVEVIDAAVERAVTEHPWEVRPRVPTLRDRPVAVGTTVLRIE